ncbi:MAG TPA: Xaa-Pro peptidase family protein [Chloroflexota bacterium]|nr:Xaa-Pro peptidase family protein [Chloroflexota bacterium]
MSADPLRDARNREALATHDLDAVVCRLPENVLLLTGYWPLSSFAFAVLTADGRSALIATDTEQREIPDGAAGEIRTIRSAVVNAADPYEAVEAQLRDVLRLLTTEGARIGTERSFEAVAPGHVAGEVLVPAARTHELIAAAAAGADISDAGPALNASRARKTPDEVERLRLANEIASFGLEAFRQWYEPGRREAEVAAQVEAAIMSRGTGYRGARHVRGWCQLMSGTGSALAYSLHPSTSARVIEPGDLGVLELGTHVDGYWSDLTRTLVAGRKTTERQDEMYAAVLAAHGAVMAAARPGMTGHEVDALAREAIEESGFGPHFVHPTGHGLGFRYHEPVPLLRPGNTGALDEGMVSSVEPGLYVEGFGGMRLEENVVFTTDGPELLSRFNVSLI